MLRREEEAADSGNNSLWQWGNLVIITILTVAHLKKYLPLENISLLSLLSLFSFLKVMQTHEPNDATDQTAGTARIN